MFCAAPHGVAAALIDSLLKAAEAAGTQAARRRHLGGLPLLARRRPTRRSTSTRTARRSASREFTCAVPEHLQKLRRRRTSRIPGCFATSILLASVPLLALGLVEPTLFVSGVTGSTGSGRKPVEGTHHPHAPQRSVFVQRARRTGTRRKSPRCAKAATGVEAEFAFVPHSGPVRARHSRDRAGAPRSRRATPPRVLGALREFYAGAPFVRVLDNAPRVKDIVASNYAHLSAVANGRTVAVMCVVDNLNKGAAGGAVQWMNRLFGLPETAGLTAPAPGWT